MKFLRLAVVIALAHFALLRGSWFWLLSFRPFTKPSTGLLALWHFAEGLYFPFRAPDDDLGLRLNFVASIICSIIWGLAISFILKIATNVVQKYSGAKN